MAAKYLWKVPIENTYKRCLSPVKGLAPDPSCSPPHSCQASTWEGFSLPKKILDSKLQIDCSKRRVYFSTRGCQSALPIHLPSLSDRFLKFLCKQPRGHSKASKCCGQNQLLPLRASLLVRLPSVRPAFSRDPVAL